MHLGHEPFCVAIVAQSQHQRVHHGADAHVPHVRPEKGVAAHQQHHAHDLGLNGFDGQQIQPVLGIDRHAEHRQDNIQDKIQHDEKQHDLQIRHHGRGHVHDLIHKQDEKRGRNCKDGRHKHIAEKYGGKIPVGLFFSALMDAHGDEPAGHGIQRRDQDLGIGHKLVALGHKTRGTDVDGLRQIGA